MQTQTSPTPDTLLYGQGRLERLVAVEVGREVTTLLQRTPEGTLRHLERSFSPWLLSEYRRSIPGARWSELEGRGHRWKAEFARWWDYKAAREMLKEHGISTVCYGSPVKQFLMATGETLFKGMRFDELHRLQLDLETTGLDPHAERAKVLMVALCDNRGNQHVVAHDDEMTLLYELVDVIQQWDPDVIEGHNLLAFDFPYLAARAATWEVNLALGRDTSNLRVGDERHCPIGPIKCHYRPAHIWGRHCVDTLLAVRRFDVAKGELDNYGLKDAAQHYGIAAKDRVLVDREQMERWWNEDRERVKTYALQDVAETRALAELVTPTEFYQAQMVPDSYQNVCTTGSGEKINSLLVRNYLAAGAAIPHSQPTREYVGGYTDVRQVGVIRNVVKADVESLYPSIMLNYDVKPEGDVLGVFLPMLRLLTDRRLDAKAKLKTTEGVQYSYWDGLQNSFKIFINSFYGYLGAGRFWFNSPVGAEKVTTTGQEIVKRIATLMEVTGALVIEVDTDGVYFVPPAGIEGEHEARKYVDRVGRGLPDGIRLAFDGAYDTMISLKIKNYVLVAPDGKRTYKGASLRSRGDEKFGKEFLGACVDALIAGEPEKVGHLYHDWAERLVNGELGIDLLQRRERVTEKSLDSPQKKRLAALAAALGLKIGDTVWLYEREDGTLARVEDYAADANRWYYVDKLHKFASRLAPALGGEFERLCPRVSKKRVAAVKAGQQSLFEF